MTGLVEAVGRAAGHTFIKGPEPVIRLIAGLGVEGDAHAGATVQHLSRKARDPAAPNLRQVHLIHAELHDELRRRGFAVDAGDMGENVTTRGLDLLSLPTGTRLLLGGEAVVEITGLRNPCVQLDRFRTGASWPPFWTGRRTALSSARRASWASCWSGARSAPVTGSPWTCPHRRTWRSRSSDRLPRGHGLRG